MDKRAGDGDDEVWIKGLEEHESQRNRKQTLRCN